MSDIALLLSIAVDEEVVTTSCSGELVCFDYGSERNTEVGGRLGKRVFII